jgi:type IV fimbrial biogenesis protein FimT
MMEKKVMHSYRYHLRPDTVRQTFARGFTLIELMIAVAVLAILLGIAVPSFNEATLSSKLGSTANNFVASATLARSEAIKRNMAITLCVSTDGASCASSGGWEQGWMVACKTTDNISCDGTGPNLIALQRQQPVSAGFKISEASSIRIMTFEPTGVGATQATLTVCRATPTVGAQQRQIGITATGRASVTKITSTTCS